MAAGAGRGAAETRAVYRNNRFRYVGGTVNARTSRFDWNSTVKVEEGWLEIVIAPSTKLRMEIWRVHAILYGPGAERRLADRVSGTKLTAPPALFGAMPGGREQAIGLIFDLGDGKEQTILLEGMSNGAYQLAQLLSHATGKRINR
jgi:hypothetical protein